MAFVDTVHTNIDQAEDHGGQSDAKNPGSSPAAEEEDNVDAAI